MRMAKNDVPIKIDSPNAVARQQLNFGDATSYGPIGGEYFTMKSGTDITPLLQGLEHDMCQAPHWGYCIKGAVTVVYEDQSSERIQAGDLFYWPPGHTVKANDDTEFVLFSPQHEHTPVLDHINSKLGST